MERITSSTTPFRPYGVLCAVGVSALLAAGGCKDPSDSVPAAKVGSAAPAAEKAPAAEAAPASAPKAADGAVEMIALTAQNATVGFVGSKVTGSHDGGFKSLSGSLHINPEDLMASKAEITIEMASTFSDSEKLTGHLMSPDFFNAKEFPQAKFTVTSLKESSDAKASHIVVGELTLHGVTKPIEFPAQVSLTDKNFTATAEFAINRKDFGIMYAGMKDDLIRDGVVIKLNINVSRDAS